jgi:hypothetical protein
MVIRPHAASFADSTATTYAVLGAGVATVVAIGLIALHLKRAQVAAERRNHLLAWHLKQLVSEAPAAPSEPSTGSR